MMSASMTFKRRRSGSRWGVAGSVIRHARQHDALADDRIVPEVSAVLVPRDGLGHIEGGVEVGHVDAVARLDAQRARDLAHVGPGVVLHRRRPAVDHPRDGAQAVLALVRSEEHTSELQSLMRISYAVFCLKKKTKN